MERIRKAQIPITVKPNSVDPEQWARYNERKRVPAHLVYGPSNNARPIDPSITIPSMDELAGIIQERT